MKKINKKSIVSGFKVLSILAFSLLMIPAFASADAGLNTTFQTPIGYNSNNTGYTNNTYSSISTPYQPPVYQAPVVSSSPMVVTYTPARSPAVTVAKANTTPVANPASALAATAIFGSNSFLPSGLIQWVLFAILILLIVILVRKILGAEARYHAAPLKHE